MISLVNDTIDKKDIDKLVEWLKTYPRLTKGPVTLEYEAKWSQWLGCKYSVFVNSGSSANLLMLYALLSMHKLQSYKIVVPGLCWATDLSPVIQLGLTPILCDIDINTLSVDVQKLEQLFIEEKPGALLLVSILGFAPDMDRIQRLCDDHNVILLEDNCESLGTIYDHQKLGTFGLMSSFSTYFGHHISTIEGGMICTNDKDVYDRLLMLRSHGWDRDLDHNAQRFLRECFEVSDFNALYTFYESGFNLRSTDLQAFIGLGQLDKLDSIIRKRNENFQYLQEHIKNDFWKPNPLPNTYTSNFCYPIMHPEKDRIVDILKSANIEIRPLVCGTMGRQPFYVKKYGVKELDVCDVVDKYGFYIPNHPGLTKDDLNLMIELVNLVTKK